MGWYVIVGSIPIGIVGFALKDVIKNDLRSLWVVAIALIAWSSVMVFAERRGRQERAERDLTLHRRPGRRAWCSASRWSRASPGPARRSRPACCAGSTG